MAKVSSIDKNKKRKILEQKYRVKSEELKELARISYVKGEIPFGVQLKLQSIPRNANPTRLKNRCELCGRARSVYRRFKMCRLCLRKFAMCGFIPGLKKSSW